MRHFGLLLEVIAVAIGIFSLHAMGVGVAVLLVLCGIAAAFALVLGVRRNLGR